MNARAPVVDRRLMPLTDLRLMPLCYVQWVIARLGGFQLCKLLRTTQWLARPNPGRLSSWLLAEREE